MCVGFNKDLVFFLFLLLPGYSFVLVDKVNWLNGRSVYGLQFKGKRVKVDDVNLIFCRHYFDEHLRVHTLNPERDSKDHTHTHSVKSVSRK